MLTRLAAHLLKTSADIDQVVGQHKCLYDIAADAAYGRIPRCGDAIARLKRHQVEPDRILPDNSYLIKATAGVHDRSADRQRHHLAVEDVGIPGGRHAGDRVNGREVTPPLSS